MPKLKDLRFGFAPFDDGHWNEGSWEEESGGYIEWYVPLWKFLGYFQWPGLESLRLDGMIFCEKGLGEFIARHARTLKSLKLFSIALWHGSFQGLLTSLRSVLKLDNFISGEPHAHFAIVKRSGDCVQSLMSILKRGLPRLYPWWRRNIRRILITGSRIPHLMLEHAWNLS